MFVLTAAAGWPSKTAHAETMAGFPGEKKKKKTTTVNYINPISRSTHLVQARLTCRLTRLAKGPQALVGKLLN